MLAVLRAAVISVVAMGALMFFLVRKSCSCTTKAKAYRAAMKSDLRNLVSAEESYRDSLRTYAAELDSAFYMTSVGVRVRVVEASDSGFSAQAVHRNLPGMRCSIFVGRATSPVPGAREGEPQCQEREAR